MPIHPRFFCSDLTGQAALLDADESMHARRSLRLSNGDVVELFDGRGRTAAGVIVDAPAARRSARAHARSPLHVAIRETELAPPPARTLTLIVAACKGPRLTWMVEKCTELGVTRLVLAEFERSVVHAGAGQLDKLRRTAIEACKQCGRAWLPAIEPGAGPAAVWADVRSQSAAGRAPAALLIAHPDPSAPPAGAWFADSSQCEHAAAVVGPEGGLTDGELGALQVAGGTLVRLCEHTLRVETAAVAIAAAWAIARSCTWS